uniref:Protein-tyrosine-phosphatase n=1 Tax=Amphimedon queenslandica TaxID=400682 RepID=A0A1X7TAG7_AMPQE
GLSNSEEGWYKCCLPTNCSDPNTNIIFADIFRYAEIESFTVADLPSDMTVYPQEYKLNCTKIGFERYDGISMSIGSTALASYTNCDDRTNTCSGTVLVSGNPNTLRYTVDITWDGMNVSSGSISQSTTGDQMYQCVLDNFSGGIDRTRTLTIKVPATAPSSLTEVSKTTTTITVSWTALNSSDADGYVVNVTSDTDTVQTVQLEGISNNTITLNGLNIETTYSITVRAYQELLGPASTISVQTLPVINSINWTLVTSITQLNNTQYRIDCVTTTDINPSTDVYWLVNGVMKSNSNYSSIDVLTYNSTLLVYPDPLGVSVNVTCIAMIGGVEYSQSVILHAPSGPPNNVRGFILNATSIKVNWTTSSEINGYVIEYTTGGVTRNVVSTSEEEIVLTDLSPMSTYTISVYSYIDLPSVNSTVTVLKFDVPSPVTSLSVFNVSTTGITVKWTIPSSDNYVTYYTISYTPSCPELSSVNETVSVAPHQSTTTYSYTLIGLYSGMNYTITVRAGNVLGGSDPSFIDEDTLSIAPTGDADFLFLLQPINNLTWNEVNCSERNGLITGYTVIISNSSITYYLTSTERYIILNDLVFGTEYNISVAAVNSVGRGPFSDPIEVEIGIVPGPVGSVSSIMDTTWAVISWSVPSFIPSDYPIITYEIGYHILQSGNCSIVDDDDIDIQMLQLSNSTNGNTFINITGLNDISCYIFGVRAYTDNGYGEWTAIANETLEIPPLPSPSLISTTQYFTTSSVISSSVSTTRDTSTTTSLVQPSTTASTSPPAVAGDTGLSPVVLGGAGGGALVGILIVIVLILIVVLVLRRKKRSKDTLYISGGASVKKDVINDIPLLEQKTSLTSEPEYEAMTASLTVEVTEANDLYTTVDTAKEDPLYANVEQKGANGVAGAPPAFDPRIPNTCSVSISDLGTHVASYHSDNNTAFNQQYQELYTGEDLPTTVGFSEQNKPFNRFKNIAPYDEHMIVLQKKPNMELCEREYINATYIDGYSSANKFIAAQGPMKKTLVDFWRLIWQEKPVSIVMVTNLKEGTKSKCEQYWPNGRAESEEFGPFSVTLVDEQVLPDFVIRSITGYREKRAFIIAQSPMENTVRDFWKMIVDYKVSAIVMLCGEEDCCYPYWTGPKTHDDFVVEITNEIKSNGYMERMFKVSFDKESRNVLQLQVTDWPQDGVVREPRTVLQVIDDVIHRQQKIGGGPVVVHCSDTVSRSGVYCSVSIGLEQCKAEGVVDVFQVTKAVRRSKPGAVTTLEQYTSIYDVIDMYLQMNS